MTTHRTPDRDSNHLGFILLCRRNWEKHGDFQTVHVDSNNRLFEPLVPGLSCHIVAFLPGRYFFHLSFFQLLWIDLSHQPILVEFTEIVDRRVSLECCPAKFCVSEYHNRRECEFRFYEDAENLHFAVLFTHTTGFRGFGYIGIEFVNTVRFSTILYVCDHIHTIAPKVIYFRPNNWLWTDAALLGASGLPKNRVGVRGKARAPRR